jgi:2'-5' RNA ligase
MAFVGIKVPEEVGEYLKKIPVPGKPEPLDHLHITMLYLGKNVPVDRIMKAGLVAYEIGQQFHEFDCIVQRVTKFPPGPDGVPIICPVESEVAHEFRAKLAEAFDANRIEYSKKFPEWKPHVTLSYASESDVFADVPLKAQRWSVEEINIWGGDEGEDKVVVKIPLTEGIVEWLL